VTSPARRIADRLATLGPDEALRALSEALAGLTVVEQAILASDWEGTWAREKQIVPLEYRSSGLLTGRRFGKTRSNVEHVIAEAQSGRAMRIGLASQTEDKGIEVLVHGEAGIIACSPPWFRARWELGRVIFPNGAQCFVFTPEVPGNIRGPGVHLFLASEIQSWPLATGEEALMNALLMTSLGYARFLWEATPKRRHPLIRFLLDRAEAEPDVHRVVRGTIHEARDHLGAGVIVDLEKAMGGTQRGREELLGEFADDDDEALWRAEWLHRAPLPPTPQLARRVIALDPAIGTKEESDSTGFAEAAADRAGQCFLIADSTGKYPGLALMSLAIQRYVAGRCDLLLVEVNRGGSTWVELLRAVAEKHCVRIEVVTASHTPRHVPGVVHVREINSKGSKGERAAPVAALYERGRVTHVDGADLRALESLMTTWVPPPPGTRAGGRRSPDALDAAVMALGEVAGLGREARPDARAAVQQAAAGAMRLAAAQPAPRSPTGLPAMLGRSRGRTI
jgi:phage terminase large subunit-like protein